MIEARYFWVRNGETLEIWERTPRDGFLHSLPRFDTTDTMETVEAVPQPGVLRQIVDECDRLRDENARLRTALRACADDLQAAVEAEYPEESRKYPSVERRYRRDMSTVQRARAALRGAGDE